MIDKISDVEYNTTSKSEILASAPILYCLNGNKMSSKCSSDQKSLKFKNKVVIVRREFTVYFLFRKQTLSPHSAQKKYRL